MSDSKQMNNIIKKSGIKPIPAYDIEIYMLLTGEWCQKEPVRELEERCNELLKALIKECLKRESDRESGLIGDYSIKAIEKACHPLKWPEIKKLKGE